MRKGSNPDPTYPKPAAPPSPPKVGSGPAFPATAEHGLNSGMPGMDLRDYFAAHAPRPTAEMALADHCAYRYRYADAMLAARVEGV